MSEVTPAPELSRSVSALARALMAATRTWALYPPNHPAVRTALDRLARSIDDACQGAPLAFGVTPDALLVHGESQAKADASTAEAASWLNSRDILELTFRPGTPAAALESFLSLLADDAASLRERGGPAAVWQSAGHQTIGIEQIDFDRVLEDRDGEGAARRKDDVWRAIVRGVIERRKALDEATQARLIQIGEDVLAIGDLARDVMAPACTPDGSPLRTSQAAAVLAAYRHLVSAVDAIAPERRAELLRNLASATAELDPQVVMQVLGSPDAAAAADGGADLRTAVAEAMDDAQVAHLLATALALDGQATDRLASVFGTIAPDDERRRRVLTMTRGMLGQSPIAQAAHFEMLWRSAEELLLTYNERPFVSDQYRSGLDQVGSRAEAMAADVPPDLAALIETLDQENVRRLSVTLLIDLLDMERDGSRAPRLARDAASLGEDLLLAGDYPAARTIARALAAHAADPRSVAAEGARVALDAMVDTVAFREAVDGLGELDDESAAVLADLCAAIGPASIDALLKPLALEADTTAGRRAAAIVLGFGGRAVTRLAPLAADGRWHAQRSAARLLGRIGAAEGVALLQPLLRSGDARVLGAAVGALSSIDDPAAGRSIHTALRASTGGARQAVVEALVAERDPRVVPLLARILDESDPLGADHEVVLETLGAVGALGGDGAIPAVDRVMRRKKWFARAKLRAVKSASVRALAQIGTPAADAAIAGAATTGDRLLKQAAAATKGSR